MTRRLLLAVLVANVSVSFAGFPGEEYEMRLQRAQQEMRKEGLGALFLTMEVHHLYFTGMSTEFWSSPTRPYYLVIPAEGKITAVVPTITQVLYEDCRHTVGQVRSWASPRPEDDGISLLVEVLQDLAGKSGNLTIGAELGAETSMRMPVNDFLRLRDLSKSSAHFQDASLLLFNLRAIKSEAEIALTREACKQQSKALDNIPNVVSVGMTERQICRLARIELLKAGQDRVPYITCRSANDGYTDIVGAATDRRLQQGDVLIIDTGSMLEGYFCDFNRNWYFGWEIPPELKAVQNAVYSAVDAGIAAAVPGSTTADVFHAMDAKLPGPASTVGRSGHSVGSALTEWPSILSGTAKNSMTLKENMVFAFEPSLGYGDHGQFLVHEEVIVIRKGGAELLSPRGPRSMPLITNGLAVPTSVALAGLVPSKFLPAPSGSHPVNFAVYFNTTQQSADTTQALCPTFRFPSGSFQNTRLLEHPLAVI